VGDRAQASDVLGRALVLAVREGQIRVFLDAGPGLSAVLRRVKLDSPGGQHARAVLAAGGDDAAGDAPATGPDGRRQPLLEPLSDRELDVLRLLDSDLSGPAIARELSVSVNTVRTHTQHIFTKLGVTNRREAVREAARLGLQRRSSR
jgi:LuxR family maltose regulon positive regulatory protein